MRAPPIEITSGKELETAAAYIKERTKDNTSPKYTEGSAIVCLASLQHTGVYLATMPGAVKGFGQASDIVFLDSDTSEILVATKESIAAAGSAIMADGLGHISFNRARFLAQTAKHVFELAPGGEKKVKDRYSYYRTKSMREPEDFVHLHNHSVYSLLDGASTIDGMCERAFNNGQPGLALTDHGFMYGIFKFHKACSKAGIKPIAGLEVYMVDDLEKPYVDAGNSRRRWEYHQTLIAMNQEGWANLCKLASLACERHFYYVPRIDHKTLFEHSKGLIVLSGCFKGMVAHYLQHRQLREGEKELPYWLKRDVDKASNYMRMYKEALGDRYYAEVQNIDFLQYMQIVPEIMELAQHHQVPMVITNDNHYEIEEDAVVQAMMTRMSKSSVGDGIGAADVKKGVYFIKDKSQMMGPGYTEDMFSRTCEIMERCNLQIPMVGDPGFQFLFPTYPVEQDPDWAAFQESQNATHGATVAV